MRIFHLAILLAAGFLGLVLWSPAYAASPCDLNNDALTNVSDVQLCANQAIGIAPCSNGDIDLNGTCNVIDVQRVANAALGGQCVAPAAGADTVWVEDTLPAGAVPNTLGGDSWNWISAGPAPFSGALAHQSAIAAGLHQHGFTGTTNPFSINAGDSLFTYVYLDPSNPPSEVMLQWYDGSFEHRAYWGSDAINVGVDGTASRYPMGALPPTGQWVRLTVPASLVGLEGRGLTGMTFTLNGGRATWDRAGKSGPGPGGTIAPVITSGLSASATTGVAFSYQITASNSPTSFSATGLPAGLSVNTATGLISGTPTTAGTFNVSLSATNTSGIGTRSLTLTVGASITARGPQPTITCPAGSVGINPGTNNIQAVVNAYPGATTFCLKAGVFSVTSPITPKSGNTFVGQYGAVLDGTGWTTTVYEDAAFKAHNVPADDVTIRNLVIRDMPQRGIHGNYTSNRWTIENNELVSNLTGLNAPSNSWVRNNSIHHNVGPDPNTLDYFAQGGGYLAFMSVNTLFENNEIAYNGRSQKITVGSKITFRNNFVHHNQDGIWYDGDNVDSLIEGNVVEDNTRMGIFYEISGRAVIRNNTVRRNGDNAIFISTSRDTEIYGNFLEDNFHSINYFIACDRVEQGVSGMMIDLINNNSHDNTIKVGSASNVLANILWQANCTDTQLAAYTGGSKNLVFQNNRYYVPSLTTYYWLWASTMRSFSAWQALGHDTTGSVQLGSPPTP